MQRISADVTVIGAGPAGLAAAVALAAAGVSVALVGSPTSDHRTTALLGASVTALETLGVWQRCRDEAAPLEVMRIIDGTRRLWRAPEVRFSCDEIGLDAFGWNIENRALVAALAAAVQECTAARWLQTQALAIDLGVDSVDVQLDDESVITTRLLVGADGRRSICRTAAGIETEGWSYPQVAMTYNLTHSRPHSDISTEFHTEHGPFTLVPLPGRRSSLVWVAAPDEARRVGALDEQALAEEIERHSHSILGKSQSSPAVALFRSRPRPRATSQRIASSSSARRLTRCRRLAPRA